VSNLIFGIGHKITQANFRGPRAGFLCQVLFS